jgi:hypothetical protein
LCSFQQPIVKIKLSFKPGPEASTAVFYYIRCICNGQTWTDTDISPSYVKTTYYKCLGKWDQTTGTSLHVPTCVWPVGQLCAI